MSKIIKIIGRRVDDLSDAFRGNAPRESVFAEAQYLISLIDQKKILAKMIDDGHALERLDDYYRYCRMVENTLAIGENQ